MLKFSTELEPQKWKGIREHYGSLGYKLQAVDILLWKLYHSLKLVQPSWPTPFLQNFISLYEHFLDCWVRIQCPKICSMLKRRETANALTDYLSGLAISVALRAFWSDLPAFMNASWWRLRGQQQGFRKGARSSHGFCSGQCQKLACF